MTPVLDAIVSGAARATGAASAWLLRADGSGLVVAATTLGVPAGTPLTDGGSAPHLVLRTGQPLSVAATSSGATTSGLDHLVGGVPTSLLCVPCPAGDEIAGVLVLLDKQVGGSFTIDDVEVADLVAGIAGTALVGLGA